MTCAKNLNGKINRLKKFGRNLKWIIHGAMVKEVKNGRKRIGYKV